MTEQPPLDLAVEQAVQTATAKIHMDPRGILWVVINNLDHQLSDARDNVAASLPLLHGTRPPLLVDIRQAGVFSSGARNYYGGPVTAKYHCARALLIGSPASRILATLMISFGRPSTPTKAFTNEADAITWLMQFVEA